MVIRCFVTGFVMRPSGMMSSPLDAASLSVMREGITSLTSFFRFSISCAMCMSMSPRSRASEAVIVCFVTVSMISPVCQSMFTRSCFTTSVWSVFVVVTRAVANAGCSVTSASLIAWWSTCAMS
ncbi:hypothetical protein NP493_2g12004 [Ridgeia piscesae]|uniref:Uncharacterized protein n=1 Tax=Ridgeia piscesae TaxID=27915 RepID=A0AAD9ULQ6_RIDPI|nr:hypothetical protein NP493_2g12004 [Ridgeia piscesae]